MAIKQKIQGSISRRKLPILLNMIGGRMFTAEFVKRDGSLRQITGRFGVRKYTQGGVNKAAENNPNLKVVWEIGTPSQPIDGGQYRMINLDTVKRIRANGMDIHVRD